MPPILRPRSAKKFTPTVISRVLRKSPPKNWFHLPAEMREMIIEEMDPKTRCKFAQCSKLCEYEAKGSNKYLYGIEIVDEFRHFSALQLRLLHCPETLAMDYWFEFEETRSNQTVVLYRSNKTGDKNRDIKWIKVESGEPNDVRLRYFNEYSNRYKNSIRQITFYDRKSPNIDYNVKHLTKLEKISCFKNVITLGRLNLEQVSKATNVYLEKTKLTFEEIIQLNGSECTIESDDFDDEAISKYLKMRKNGEVHKNMKELTIYFENPGRRNYEKITNGLNVFNYEEPIGSCNFRFNVKDHSKDECYVKVKCSERAIYIEINPDCRC